MQEVTYPVVVAKPSLSMGYAGMFVVVSNLEFVLQLWRNSEAKTKRILL